MKPTRNLPKTRWRGPEYIWLLFWPHAHKNEPFSDKICNWIQSLAHTSTATATGGVR